MDDYDYPLSDVWRYSRKMLFIYSWKVWQWLNHHFLKTYRLIEDCARCDDCGRNVHDFSASDELWAKVTGHENGGGILCYDCFCDKADRKGIHNYQGVITDGR